MRAAPKVLLPLMLLAFGTSAATAGAWERTSSFLPALTGAGHVDRLQPPPLAGRLAPVAAAARPSAGVRIPVTAPVTAEVSQATRTLYVTSEPGGTVAVIDAAGCNAHRARKCGAPVASINVGPDAGALAVDDRTGTLYVSHFSGGTVSVIDATTCNATDTSGCGATPAEVKVSGNPLGVAVNEHTHTVYVGSAQDFVSVIDARACNGSDTSGCGQTPTTIATNPGAGSPTIDDTTNTLYVPEGGTDEQAGNTMAVIDIRACNAATTTGCKQAAAHVTVGFGPAQAVVDHATATVFVGNAFELSVSVVDASACNARDTSGCDQTAPTVHVGEEPNSNLVIDERLRSLYVANTGSDTLSVVDLKQCSARRTAGCARPPRTMATGNQPWWVVLDPATHTLYVIERIDEDVLVLDATRCNARRHSGCRHEAPTVSVEPSGVLAAALDPAQHTLYVISGQALSLLDTRTCRAGAPAACQKTLVQLTAPWQFPRDVIVDRATHTLYVADPDTDTVSVLDTTTCNATRQGGCAPLATVTSEGGPWALALNPGAHTIYVGHINSSTVSVIHGARCNATNLTGCADTPLTVEVAPNAWGVAVDPGTNTVYVSNVDFEGDHSTVSLLDGTACDQGTAACAVVATAITGPRPNGLDIDRATHTLYVANFAFGEAPGSMSVIDTRTCNAADTSGCGDEPASVRTGRGPWAVLVDQATHRVYTSNFSNATVSVIEGARCNATTQTGCDRPSHRVPVGNITLDLTLDRGQHTLYALNAPDRTLSLIDSRRPCGPPVRCLN